MFNSLREFLHGFWFREEGPSIHFSYVSGQDLVVSLDQQDYKCDLGMHASFNTYEVFITMHRYLRIEILDICTIKIDGVLYKRLGDPEPYNPRNT